MADKYCDHGAYTSAAITGSISGTTLTVSAVSSGVVCVGARVNLPGALDGTSISAAGTGAGGTGTYTVSRSQTLGSVSGTTDAGYPWATPTWGSAQEGDGTASGAATSATVSIDLSSATAGAGDTISILGATLTCVASGASTNQFNAATGATLVSNLVTAINRTTNTVTVTAQAAGWTTPKLQDAVFARVGSPTTTLEIMTRAGSATYNSGTVAQSGIAGVTGPWTFSGGAGGAWGYLVNPTYTSAGGLIWPSGQAFSTYGVWVQTKPLAGAVAAGDDVHMRAKRAVCMFYNQNPGIVLRSAGTEGNPVRFIADNGTVWADTNPILDVLAHYWVNSGAFAFSMAANNSEHHELLGQYNSNGTRSLRLRNIEADSGFNLVVRICGPTLLKTFDIDAPGGRSVRIDNSSSFTDYYTKSMVVDGRVACPLNNNPFVVNNNGVWSNQSFVGVEFDATGTTAPTTGGVVTMGQAGYPSDYEYIGCKFTGFVTGSELTAFTAVTQGHVIFDGCTFDGVTKRGPYIATGTQIQQHDARHRCVSLVSRSGLRDFMQDSPFGLVEWNSQQSQPTCSALLDDGATPWSIKALPTVNAAAMSALNPLRLPRLSKINSLADGARTLTLQFVAESTIAPTLATVSMSVHYEQTDGTIAVIDTYRNPDATLTASTATWTNESGGYVTFQNGGTVNHSKWKLEIETPTAIKTGSEIGVEVSVRKTSASSTKTYFFDPEIGVA